MCDVVIFTIIFKISFEPHLFSINTSIIIAENRLDPNDISITGEITIQPDASNEQIPQDIESSNKPKHHVDPADPRLSLKIGASVDSSTSPNSNDSFADSLQHDTITSSSPIDDIKDWEIKIKNDPFFDNGKEDIWGDDGWDDKVVTEVRERNSNPSTINRVESLPQKQNITTVSPDFREKTNNDSQNGYHVDIEMTTKNFLTSNKVDEYTERISTNSMINETTGKLRNNTINTSLTPLLFELGHPKRIETNSSSPKVPPNEDLDSRKSKIENTNSIQMNKKKG